MNNTISIYVANLGKYNEGEIIGGWLKLPMSENELEEFYTNILRLNQDYEEHIILDYECKLFSINEYTSIEQLNTIAKIIVNLTEKQINSAFFYLKNYEIDNPLEVINVLIQADDIPYFSYNFDGCQKLKSSSTEELLGYQMAEDNGLWEIVQTMGVSVYFDFESYGNSFVLCGEIIADKNGYMSLTESLDHNKYTYVEIKSALEEWETSKSLNESQLPFYELDL